MKVYKYKSTTEVFQKTFETSKAGNSALTIELFAKRLNLGTSTLKMIMSGKRKPNVHQVLSLARGCRFSPTDTSYLETLALKERAKDGWEKAYYTKLLPQKKKQVTLSTIVTSEQELLLDPIILPLLVYLMEAGETVIDCSYLAKELHIEEKKVNDLVTQLQKSKVLIKQNDGKFHVAFNKLTNRLIQKKYQRQLLDEAAKKIETEYESPTSLFVSYAFSATDESLIQLQMDLKSLMEKYMDTDVMKGKRTKVAQACFQVFPVIANINL